MRHYFLIASAMIVFARCQQSKPNEPPKFLPGIYVSRTETEFCIVLDTFVIRKTSLDAGGYLVTRKSSFQRIRQGTRIPPEFQADQWPAIYDEAGGKLSGTIKGKELYYLQDKNVLFDGGVSYEKVE